MNVSDFDFELPAALIAQEPPARRGDSRLLVLDRRSGAIVHTAFAQIGDFLRAGDLLVVNDTRVFPARLRGKRVPSGGAVECLLLSPRGEDIWEALVHPGQKLKPGARMEFQSGQWQLFGEILDQRFFGRRSVRLWTTPGESVTDVIDSIGHIPLPPYIKRDDRPDDRDRYQTIYATHRGSVAAPTAGLHFTEEILADLCQRGIQVTSLTLHIGYGTFKPVRTERVEDHTVDPEIITLGPEAGAAISETRREGRRVIAVGTTTVRALESLALRGEIAPMTGPTTLFITPGFEFRVVDGLITNFHLPRSSLLMLVAALAGRDRLFSAYRAAVARGYRFYSYGDAMLVL